LKRLFYFSEFDSSLLRKNWAQTEAVNVHRNENVILTRAFNDILQWQLVMVINKTDLLAPLKQSVQYSWIMAGISVILSIGLSLVISILVSRPIKRIAHSLKEVGEGNLNTSISIDREDEIGYLALHFNLMTKKIGLLLTDLKTSEEQKKQSDFRALHAQIKPHFLYNTLNTISMLGRRGDSARMDQLISALTNQLHYALDNSPDPVTLREELKAVENYIEMMIARYPDKCRFELDIDPLSLEYKLPKFILQPLIENAIFHGIVPKEEGGLVFIGTMVEDGHWEIIIEDEGVGMDPDTLRTLTDRLQHPVVNPESHEHIGLLNIHERFQLMFGNSYMLHISSKDKAGTQILIKLPKEGNGEAS
jgi:two-component system sensor histidine kinase YesM